MGLFQDMILSNTISLSDQSKKNKPERERKTLKERKSLRIFILSMDFLLKSARNAPNWTAPYVWKGSRLTTS